MIAFLSALCGQCAFAQEATAIPRIEQFRNAGDIFFQKARDLENARAGKKNERSEALAAFFDSTDAFLKPLRSVSRQLRADQKQMDHALKIERQQIARIMGGLQSISASPLPLLLLHPTGADGTIHSSLLMRERVPELLKKIETLEAQSSKNKIFLERLASFMSDVIVFADRLQTARIDFNRRRTARIDLPPAFFDESENLALYLKIEATRTEFEALLTEVPEDAASNFEMLKGKLPWPIPLDAPPLQSDGNGNIGPSRGIELSPPPAPLPIEVFSPVDATVLYAGPYLTYKTIIILEPHPDYVILLAGLSSHSTNVGDIILAGEPVGVLKGEPLLYEDNQNDDKKITFISPSTMQDKSTLYLELRKNGISIDSLPWFEQILKVTKK